MTKTTLSRFLKTSFILSLSLIALSGLGAFEAQACQGHIDALKKAAEAKTQTSSASTAELAQNDSLNISASQPLRLAQNDGGYDYDSVDEGEWIDDADRMDGAEAGAATSCTSSRDCLPASEHCLNGQCVLRSTPCYNNFDCSGTDRCVSGVCRAL